MPPWDDLQARLPAYRLPELYKLRTGQELPADFEMRTHGAGTARKLLP